MLFRLLLLFIFVPLVELYLLLQLADATSAGATFLIVIATGVLGSYLAKREGLMAWQKFHAALGEGRVPSREIQDGLMIVFAAALLLTPGLITDAVGFLLLVPVGRDLLRKTVLARYFSGFKNVQIRGSFFEGQSRQTFDDSNTIDGKVTRR
ncbi:FxsA family protein [Roseiconus lacunae]|nr:FxsA family protein [Roseiconus lacunae]MCD0460411.1 FxsA family protein [Roseiconus lacunae]WRQ52781.1 FxsA family protein [Stieleria sp. HD01]